MRSTQYDKRAYLGCSIALVIALSFAGKAGAQCAPEALIARVTTMMHTGSRVAAPAETTNCRRAESVAHLLAPRRPSAFSVVATRGMRVEMERATDSAAVVNVEQSHGESPIAARFDLQWRDLRGPSFRENVPDWVIKNAVSYHRRGLPIVQLWQSTNYQLALGLSNHRVPGIYFMQKVR